MKARTRKKPVKDLKRHVPMPRVLCPCLECQENGPSRDDLAQVAQGLHHLADLLGSRAYDDTSLKECARILSAKYHVELAWAALIGVRVGYGHIPSANQS